MKIEALLFDLDGTIANTLPLCIKVYQQTLENQTGRSYTEEEIISHFGITEAGIFQRIVPDHWEECLNYYHKRYEELHYECSEPFTGIKPILDLLQSRGIKMAIITGKGPHTAHLTAQYLQISGYFLHIETGNEQNIVKADAITAILRDWNIAAEHAAYIGDSDTDIEHARLAGVQALAAAWAETTMIHQLTIARPDHVFTTVEQFYTWIEDKIESIDIR